MVCACLVAAIAGASTANAQTAGDFYRDKTLTLVVGYGVGGGYDVYARLLARHIARHIPGTPTVIVQNMPGAGSLTALRHQDAIAPKDGTVVTLFDFVQIINARLNPERTRLDLAKYSFIGSVSEDLSVCYVWHARGIDTLDDLRKAAVVHMGLTAAGSMQDIRFKVLSRMLGVNVKPVLGYAGTARNTSRSSAASSTPAAAAGRACRRTGAPKRGSSRWSGWCRRSPTTCRATCLTPAISSPASATGACCGC